VELPTNAGGRSTDFIDWAAQGLLKGFYIMGEDPMHSDPNSAHVREALQKLEFIVVQEIFMTETAQLADVVLPGASFAEKEGTFTNTERRVQRVRKAVDPPGEARPDWQILCDVATAMGYPCIIQARRKSGPKSLRSRPAWRGSLMNELKKIGIQWPCPTPEHPGTSYLHAGRFTRERENACCCISSACRDS